MSSRPGISTADIDTIFKALSRKLPGLINAGHRGAGRPRPRSHSTGKFSGPASASSSLEVLKALGFPFDRGRLDESEHPFTEGVPGDIRVTTRFDANDPFSGLLGAVHETGHAMYDLGLPVRMARSARRPRPRPRAGGEPVAAVRDDHLPQPRVRARTCVRCWTSTCRSAGTNGSRTNLYRHLIRVRRSLIRMDADELTYPVHIMLRYELEKKMSRWRAAVARSARSVERQSGAAAGHPADERCRRLPAGHPLGGRALRLLSLLRARGRHRRSAERGAARRASPTRCSRSRRGQFGGLFGLAARERARGRREARRSRS